MTMSASGKQEIRTGICEKIVKSSVLAPAVSDGDTLPMAGRMDAASSDMATSKQTKFRTILQCCSDLEERLKENTKQSSNNRSGEV